MPKEANYDESKVPAYNLTDPLKMEDGTPVGTAEQWWRGRRPEILEIFSSEMYGKAPRRQRVTGEPIDDAKIVFDGLAKRQRIRVPLTPGPNPHTAEMLLYTPNKPGRHPAFIGLNFVGNHAVTTETDVPLSVAWFPEGPGRHAVNHRATEQSRGQAASRWQLELVLARGYAVATICYQEVEPDHEHGWRDGLRGRMEAMTGYPVSQWGAISAWAWGLSCAMDCLEAHAAIDAKRVAVIGHSRLGKTALWAAANDDRFAIAVSNNSGEGGAAISRRCYGETIEFMTRTFPHWLLPSFRKYADNEAALPIDQHQLIALIAPRPVYIASAAEDQWADPRGEFLSGVHAGPVYRLLGKEGLGTDQFPELESPVGDTVRYHIRRGIHNVTKYDWEQYLAFADRHFSR